MPRNVTFLGFVYVGFYADLKGDDLFVRFKLGRLTVFDAADAAFDRKKEAGRQKSHIPHGFCLLSGPRIIILEGLVDKNHTFLSVFIYFQVCARLCP